jgi:hypothetical protein
VVAKIFEKKRACTCIAKKEHQYKKYHVQVSLIPMDKSIKYHGDLVTQSLKWFYKISVCEGVLQEDAPKQRTVRELVLYMAMISLTKSTFASENVKVINHPPCSSYLSPCAYFLFHWLKKMHSGMRYTPGALLTVLVISVCDRFEKKFMFHLFDT